MDYDGQRHNFQSLQGNPKKKDDVKMTRSKELLDEAKRTYEQLNSELHDELPALHDSRVLFLVTNLQTLFSAEQVFHSESGKVRACNCLQIISENYCNFICWILKRKKKTILYKIFFSRAHTLLLKFKLKRELMQFVYFSNIDSIDIKAFYWIIAQRMIIFGFCRFSRNWRR